MSSRLTAPVSKLARSLSTSPAVARPSHLLNATSKAAAARKPQHQQLPEESERHHSTTTTTPHRPTRTPLHPPPTPQSTRFMQTFAHTAPSPLPSPLTTLDRTILPPLHSTSSYDPYAHIRVPLLPDSSRKHAQAETPDQPLPRAEIRVVAADPAKVLPAALTEVEGMGVDGVELGFARLIGREEEKEESFEMGRGMVRDLWRGMVEDVFGPEGKKAAV